MHLRSVRGPCSHLRDQWRQWIKGNKMYYYCPRPAKIILFLFDIYVISNNSYFATMYTRLYLQKNSILSMVLNRKWNMLPLLTASQARVVFELTVRSVSTAVRPLSQPKSGILNQFIYCTCFTFILYSRDICLKTD